MRYVLIVERRVDGGDGGFLCMIDCSRHPKYSKITAEC